MKQKMKTLIITVLVFSLAFTSAACSNQEAGDNSPEFASDSASILDEAVSDSADSEAIETQLESEILPETESTTEETKSQTSSADGVPVATSAVTIAEADRNYEVILQDQAVSIDGIAEVVIEYALITDKVVPTVIPEDGGYSYLQAKDGEVYVDVCIAYTNLSDLEANVSDVMSAALLCGWTEREFAQFFMEKDQRSGLTSSDMVASQETAYIHLVFGISDEYETNGRALQKFFSIEGSNYMYMVNNPTDAGDLVTNGAVESYTEISGGDVSIGDLMKEEGIYEAYIVYANISEKVYAAMPIGTTYAKADDGEKYIDICICYKNTSGEEFTVGTSFFSSDGDMLAGLVSGGETTYSGALAFENEARDSLKFIVMAASVSLAPNETTYMHLLFSIPAEIADADEASLQVYFSFNHSNAEYVFDYR